MKTHTFFKNETYLPVTMEQFEALTNEILVAVNEVCAPHFLSSDYMVQILMGAIHALDHKHGIVKKSDLFESCINRISCHVTFHATEEVRKRMGAQEAQDPETDNPTPIEAAHSEPTQEAAIQ